MASKYANVVVFMTLTILCLLGYVLYYGNNNRQKKELEIASYHNQHTSALVYNITSEKVHLFSNETIDDCITKDTIVTTKAIFPNIHLVPFSAADAKQNVQKDSSIDASRQEKFVDIFKKKLWGTGHDITSAGVRASGGGSTLYYAQEVSASLNTIINDLKEKLGHKNIRLLDIPCGDFQWMYRFLQTRDDVLYTGMDIVPDIIKRHNEKFVGKPWRFVLHDAVKTPVAESFDIVLTRHVLQHLPNHDVIKMLQHISESGSRYLLVTTFPDQRQHEDLLTIHTGAFRDLNLQLAPISLPPPLCFHKDGPRQDGGYLGFWQLPLKQLINCSSSRVKSYKFQGTDLFACF